MNVKSLTIGGALVLLAVTLIGRVNGLVTDDQLICAFWAIVAVTVSASVSYLISWAATDGYKKYNWPPNRWKDQTVKRKIFKFAWWSAGVPMSMFGAVVLIWSVTGKLLLIGSIGWLLLTACVAVTSPWLWAFVMDSLLPRLKRYARGEGPTIHRDEHGEIQKVSENGKTVLDFQNEMETEMHRPADPK